MDKNERWILQYLRKTNRFKTLKILEKDLISTAGKNICDSKYTKKEPEDKYKPVKLSFSIIKAPKRALNLDSVGVDTTNKTSKSRKEKKTEEKKKGKMFKDYISKASILLTKSKRYQKTSRRSQSSLASQKTIFIFSMSIARASVGK